MKRSALKRRTPMRRSGRIRWKPPRRLKGPGSDPAYLAAVRALPCRVAALWPGKSPCEGRLDPHHAGRRPGTSMKAPDSTAIPMCRRHHRWVERSLGIFRRWKKAQRIAWYDEQIEATQALVAGRISQEGCAL